MSEHRKGQFMRTRHLPIPGQQNDKTATAHVGLKGHSRKLDSSGSNWGPLRISERYFGRFW